MGFVHHIKPPLERLALLLMILNAGLGLVRSFGRLSFRSQLPTSSTRTLCGKFESSTREKFESLRETRAELAFDLQLPEGRCVGFSVKDPDSLTWKQISDSDDHWIRSFLHPLEISYGLKEVVSSSSLAPTSSFWVGRLAMRAALGFPDYPILRDSYGRPSLHPSILGSISHKQDVGVALVQNVAPFSNNYSSGIGVDLEVTSRPGKRSIAKRVLTKQELGELGRLPDVSVDEEILLRFSLKEAIYKAVHPLLCQYIGFQEAEVTPHANGTATCRWLTKSGAHEQLGPLTAHWKRLEDIPFFLTSASATLDDHCKAVNTDNRDNEG